MEEITRRVLEFLANPESYPHQPKEVRRLQTHASWVFLASPFVYKIKKPVDFGFLNFTTLERRRENSLAEVELNRRLAEDVYLGVAAVCYVNGSLLLTSQPQGEVMEWCVWMRELDSAGFLLQRLHDGCLTAEQITRVAERLLRFYQTQPPLPESESQAATSRIHQHAGDNLAIAQQFSGRTLSKHCLTAIAEYNCVFEATHGALLKSRSNQGWIQDTHGDLHLDHIHLSDDSIRIYDCLEFSAELRHTDVACDIAFLTMDLDFHGRPDLGQVLIQRLQDAWKDPDLPHLLTYYQCYRACVRGKVESLHSVTETAEENERTEAIELAHRYFRLALRYAIAGTRPRLFVFCGRIASGKSSLAEFLSDETGWLVFSSDRLRKTLGGVDLYHRGTDQERAILYSRQITDQVYSELQQQAIARLQAGHCVILDATYSDREHRDILRRQIVAAGFSLMWVEAVASDATVRDRLRHRNQNRQVISDAREEDFEKLAAGYLAVKEIPDAELISIPTEGTALKTQTDLLQHLVRKNASSAPVEVR